MSEFVVHSVPGSPYGRAVLATFHEKGAGYRFAPVSGGARNEPHISRHPFGRVPVLEHDSFLLYETQAIMRYLDRALPGPALTPADHAAAARMDQVMNICDWYLFQGVNNVIGFHRIIAPRLFGSAPDEAAIAAAMPKAHVVFKELSRLLGTQAYFTGEVFRSCRHPGRGASGLSCRNAGMGNIGTDESESRRSGIADGRAPKLQIDNMGARCRTGQGRLNHTAGAS